MLLRVGRQVSFLTACLSWVEWSALFGKGKHCSVGTNIDKAGFQLSSFFFTSKKKIVTSIQGLFHRDSFVINFQTLGQGWGGWGGGGIKALVFLKHHTLKTQYKDTFCKNHCTPTIEAVNWLTGYIGNLCTVDVTAFLTLEKCDNVMISVRPASWLFVCGKNFNVVIFSDTINLINVKLCMIVALLELYPCIPLSVTLIVFQGHSSVKQFNWKFYAPIRLSWNFVRLLILCQVDHKNTLSFDFRTCSRDITDIIWNRMRPRALV